MGSELAVREVLTNDYVGVSESDTVLGAAELMREEQSSCVLVVRGPEAVGIMTEWDVLGMVTADTDPTELTVGDLMSTPVLSVEATRSLSDAALLMARENIRHLVVEDDSGIVGVLTQRDVIVAASSVLTGPSDSRPSPGNPAQPIADAATNGGDEFGTQGVCEVCGSLADSLWDANGQLVCADCRSV